MKPLAFTRFGLCVLAATLACMGLSACLEPAKDTHPNQVLTKRRALFKQFTRALEPIGLVTSGRKEYKPDEMLALVQDLQLLASKPWVYFPADGNYPPTHAKPTVWSQPDAFRQAQEKYQANVHQLVLAAQGRQLPAVQQAEQAVEASCKACHRDFRYE